MNKPDSGETPVLLITTEFGQRVFGGVGRVINGLLSEDVTRNVDVLLVGQEQKFVHGPVLNFAGDGFEEALRYRNYRVVHPVGASPIVATTVRQVLEVLPRTRIVYSCHSIKKYEKDIRAEAKPATVTAEQYLLSMANWIHVLNKFSLSRLRACYPHTIDVRTTIIPNGIRAEELSPVEEDVSLLRQSNPFRHKRVVVCMSRWAWGKGIENLVEAIPLVLGSRDDVVFVIAGRKENSWEHRSSEYVAMIDRALAPYGDHVISPGWLGDSARNAYLALADVVVMPSQLEYFPYSILEPMIAGRAIISAEVGGVPEMIHGGKECLFYQPTHAVQLSEHILRLLDNGALARTLAASARARALESYQWSTIARQYMDMYASVLC